MIHTDDKPPLRLSSVLAARPDLTQRQLARAMGISPSGVAGILRRGQWPTRRSKGELISLANAWLRDNDVPVTPSLWLPETPAEVAAPQPVQTTSKPSDQPEHEMLSETTRQFFKLPVDPFQNEISSQDDVFLSTQNRLLLEEMVTAAKAGSMIALIGECGSGKTILRRLFLHRVQSSNPDLIVIEPRRLDRKQITAEGISAAICRALQVTRRGMSGEERDAVIEDALIQSAANGHRHLLIIDEAHDLPLDTLKILKRIWELTHGFSRVMGIVLLGQPELRGKLSGDQVREFAWRCAQHEVAPIGPADIHNYVAHKFGRVGFDWTKVFTEDAVHAIHGKCIVQAKLGLQAAKSHSLIDRSYPLAVNTWLTRAMNAAAYARLGTINEMFVRNHI